MNPQGVFCANPACADRGAVDKGNIKVHSHKERRFRCLSCKKTFAASTGTPMYRLHKAPALFLCVLTLLTHGCPLPAIVAAFDLDERTVADWQAKAEKAHNKAEVIVAKQRHGPTGVVGLFFDEKLTRFGNLDTAYESGAPEY